MSFIKSPPKEKSVKTQKRKSLKTSRSRAYQVQHGHCYYCHQPMWKESEQELVSRFPITSKQAQLLKCTGEHLVPHSEGGEVSQENIVAACLFCNRTRHKAGKALTSDAFKTRAQYRLSKGAWHGLRLTDGVSGRTH
ncbi:HNH endonuclease [Pseudohalioglobus sediminis]